MAHARTDEPAGVAPRLHEATDWGAAIKAGLIAGVVFMMAEMLMVWLFMGASPWGPPRMIAAMVLGRGILTPPDTFSLTAMAVAMMIHFPLSAAYGVVIGWMVHRMGMMMALLAGLGFGLVAVYAVNFYAVAPAVFPWFVEARNWVGAVAHAVFGVVAAGSYVVLREPRR